MKPFVVLFALALSGAQDWSPIATKLAESIVYVESDTSKCTGFVIDSARKYVLTANHCWGEKLFVDHMPARTVYRETKQDLLVLSVPGLERPALKLAEDNPKIGSMVASYGFGYDLERPMFRVATVSDANTYIHEGNIGGPFIMLDAAFVGGQSGGPGVNAHGDIVMIVQRASDRVGFGVGVETIRDKAGRFFEKAK